jgi:hypothetical protein
MLRAGRWCSEAEMQVGLCLVPYVSLPRLDEVVLWFDARGRAGSSRLL